MVEAAMEIYVTFRENSEQLSEDLGFCDAPAYSRQIRPAA
jgi:hypothetical protein